MPAKLDRQSYFWNGGDEVLIRNNDLPDTLVHDATKSVQDLSAIVSPITLDKINIDQSGNVIVTDANFKAQVVNVFTGPAALGVNGACGNVKCAEE
jgi:hypothetical protein